MDNINSNKYYLLYFNTEIFPLVLENEMVEYSLVNYCLQLLVLDQQTLNTQALFYSLYLQNLIGT